MVTDIQLRRYQPEDIDAVYEAVMESKTELSPWMSWCHAGYSRQETVTWVEGRAEAWERDEARDFVIVDSTGRFLGACGIHRLDLRSRVGEIGYWVRTSATGKGIGTAAVGQLRRWAFEEAGLHRLEILVAVENVGSQRVAEKAGAVREGILRERFLLPDRRHDAVLFAILKAQP